MRTAAIGQAALGLSMLGAVIGIVSSEAPARAEGPVPLSINACVRFTETKFLDQKQIEYRLDNGCTDKIACTVGWSVTCEAHTTQSDAAALLAPREGQSFTASAAGCDGDWRIGGARWSCKAQP